MLLQEFISTLKDISFHEISIHYLPHTKVFERSSCPYVVFENEFLDQSVGFVFSKYDEFRSNTTMFRNLLESESSLMSQLFLNRTYSIYYKIVCEGVCSRIERTIMSKLDSNAKAQEGTISENTPEENRRLKLLSEIVCYVRNPTQKRDQSQCFDEILCQRTNSISSEEYLEQARMLIARDTIQVSLLVDLYGESVDYFYP